MRYRLSGFSKKVCSSVLLVTVYCWGIDRNAFAQSDSSMALTMGKAIYFFNQNKLDESYAEFEKILKVDSNNKVANEYKEKIRKSKEGSSSVSVTLVDDIEKRPKVYDPKGVFVENAEEYGLKFLKKGDEAVDSGNQDEAVKNYEKAVGCFRGIVAREPLNNQMRVYLALTLFKMGEFEKSLREWEDLLKVDPDNTMAQDYINQLTNSSYEQLEKDKSNIKLPKEKKADVEKKEPFEFLGVKSKTSFGGYSSNNRYNYEDTLNASEVLKINNKFYDNPLDFTFANDLWHSHHSGSLYNADGWNNGDYELINRFRQASVKYSSKKIQFLAGDLTTNYIFSKNPNHFILPGVDIRGFDLMYNFSNESRMKFMWGYIPVFEYRSLDGERDSIFTRISKNKKHVHSSRDYFYPRELTAADFRLELHPRYITGFFFSHIEDHNAIEKIAPDYPHAENYMAGFTQSINVVPGKPVGTPTLEFPQFDKHKYWANFMKLIHYLHDNFKWYVFHEVAYSWVYSKVNVNEPVYSSALYDSYYSDDRIRMEDWATYLRSEMALPKWHNETIYQRIQPDFRNLAGFTYHQTATYDREILESKSYLFPTDNLNFSANFSKVRSDLDSDKVRVDWDTNIDVGKDDWQAGKFNMRYLPGGIFPDISMDVNIENYRNPDVIDYASPNWTLFSYCLGLTKNVCGWDLNGNYKITQSSYDNEHLTYTDYKNTYINHYNIEVFKTIFPGVDFSLGHFYSDQNVNLPAPIWDFDRDDNNHTDATLTFDLWDTSTLTLFYSYMLNTDNFDSFLDVTHEAQVHSLSVSYGWPIYLKKDLFDRQLDIYPYITCIFNQSNREMFDNVVYEPTLRLKYQFKKDNYFNLSSAYRFDDRRDYRYEEEYRLYAYLSLSLEAKKAKISATKNADYLSNYIKRPRKYTIGIADKVFIEVFKKRDYKILAEKVCTVDESGKIAIDPFGEVNVLGFTPDEAAVLISKKLSKKYSDYEVHVLIKDSINDKVTVLGEVPNPGVYNITGNLTVMEAIALAGGTVGNRADLSNVKITSRLTNKSKNVNLVNYIVDKDVEENVLVHSGDVILVPKSIKAVSGDFISGIFGKKPKDKTKLNTKTDINPDLAMSNNANENMVSAENNLDNKN